MKKIFLLIVCICLAFNVYAGRKKSRRTTKIINVVYSCKNNHRYLPSEVKKFKIDKSTGRNICPQCQKQLYAYPVEH